MTEINFSDKVELGRRAVDNYRAAHARLHAGDQYPQIHDDHTPLLEKLVSDLKEQDFNSLTEFFGTSEEQHIKELGFKDRTDFEANAKEINYQDLQEKWS